MIERISQKVLDLLQADPQLTRGGTAYAAGWPLGVTREENGDTPAAGKVNLFDKAFDPDSGATRPAIYVGTRGMEAGDALDFPTCSAGNRVEYRILTVPLIVAVQGATKHQARQMRNQLRFNVKQILLRHLLADGYWYELTMPGVGGMPNRVWTSATGGASQQVAEGMGTITVQCRYSFNASADA